MRISLGKFIKKAGDYDSENIVCPIEDYDRDKYLNRRILIRILFILLYGYGFGYMLAIESSTIQNLKMVVINFVIFYILNFYLIQIPHEFIHTLFYKNPFKNNNSLVFFNKKRIVTVELNENIHPTLLCLNLIMPFILFSILPLILIYCLKKFDLYLYSLSFANSILSSDDLLNIVLQFFIKSNEEGCKRLFVVPNNYDYLINNKNSLENNILENSNIEIIEERLAESTIDSEFDKLENGDELNNDIEIIIKENEDINMDIDNTGELEDINIDALDHEANVDNRESDNKEYIANSNDLYIKKNNI
ncbi:DUF3267 domain-containing protein [uncultured Clostridium sp.]|uniref:DUF3267 domain-containing protein n=1 Tax=Clostridium sp. TaxID=1506 RepID=UPI0025D033D0|nr:DUF3267 domain-containing protein [uncultured Clostridium sp.]